MDQKGDKYYIEQVLEGKTSAFSHLVDRHKDRAFNLAFRISGNREDAEEIAQDAFIRAYNSLGSFRMQSSFSTWFFRIVYNTSISCLRTRKKGVLSLEDFPAEYSDFAGISQSEEEAEREYKKSVLNFALQKLDEEERGLISLYYYEELDADEISDITGLSKSNIKVKLFRSRQKMLTVLEKTTNLKGIYNETKG